MLDKQNVGLDLTAFSDNGKKPPISRITLFVDDENVITAGDDSGLEITAQCPHATQPMVNALLAELKGYEYHPYEADDVNIDPATELGDGINTCGIYSVIAQIDDDGSGYPSVSAPGEAELEEEYPVGGYLLQEISQDVNRKLAETRSYIEKTAEEIKIGIESELSGALAELDVQLDSLTARVEGAEGDIGQLYISNSYLSTSVYGLSGEYATLKIWADNLRLEVVNGGTSSYIELKSDSGTISSQNIYFNGYVTFVDLLDSGTTTINGDCIKTGSISADLIGANNGIYITFRHAIVMDPDFASIADLKSLYFGEYAHIIKSDYTRYTPLEIYSYSGVNLPNTDLYYVTGNNSYVFLNTYNMRNYISQWVRADVLI